jgi:hypothetical protein
MADNNKCAHEGCACLSTRDSEYCSSACESAGDADIVEIRCECGHQGCGI